MKVEIFRRTVKDRKRREAVMNFCIMARRSQRAGDEAVIVNENRSGPTVEGEMMPTAPMAAMFGYGGDQADAPHQRKKKRTSQQLQR